MDWGNYGRWRHPKLWWEIKEESMKKVPYESNDILICECHNTEHQMIVCYGDDTVYIHTHLNKKPFWQRVKYGIKYIFGYQCRYGAFDEFILNPKDADKIKDIANYLKKK